MKAVIGSGSKPVNSIWECKIITPEAEIAPLKLNSVDIVRDYTNHYSDHVAVDLLLGRGDYTRNLMPFRQVLLVELKRVPVGEGNGTAHLNGKPEDTTVKTYRAILTREVDENKVTSTDADQTLLSANREPPLRLTFQLLDRAVEQLNLFEIGGIYRKGVPGDVLRYILTDVSNRLGLEGDEEIIGVDGVDWDNQTAHPQIVLPQGTKIQDAAAIIQDEWGGVYSTGIGCYLQGNLWYLWPEFNTRRFDQEERVALIVNLPPKRMPQAERTWRFDEYQLVILSTGDVSALDESHHDQLNEGNAVRHTHTDQMWDSPNAFGKNFGESSKDNKFRFTRGDNSSEYVGIKRPNYNVPRVSPSRLSNNSFAEASRLAKRRGMYMSVTWENSRPEHIFPGMPVRFMYLKDHEVVEVDGVIMKAHHYIHDPRPGPVQKQHLCNSALTLFIENPEE